MGMANVLRSCLFLRENSKPPRNKYVQPITPQYKSESQFIQTKTDTQIHPNSSVRHRAYRKVCAIESGSTQRE